jgi:hypothetical protein
MTGTRIICRNETTKVPKSELAPSEEPSVLVIPIDAFSNERSISQPVSFESSALEYITCYVITCSAIICTWPRE